MTSQPQRFTAEQIEDVRRLIRAAQKTGVAASAADRLQNSLFPETEPVPNAIDIKRPKTIGVDVDVILAFVQSDWDSVVEILEAIAGIPINNKAAEIARAGFNRTWGDKLGVVINANRKAELGESAAPAEEETKAEDSSGWHWVESAGGYYSGPACTGGYECKSMAHHGGCLRLSSAPASSPVVPAPTETGRKYLTVAEIPAGVSAVFDEDGDIWRRSGGDWYLADPTVIGDRFAPFVAAEVRS